MVVDLSFKPMDFEKLLRHPQKGDLLLPAPTPPYAYGLDPADANV
jgi:hypothetical protein